MNQKTKFDAASIAIGAKPTKQERSVSQRNKKIMQIYSIKQWLREIRIQKLERKNKNEKT